LARHQFRINDLNQPERIDLYLARQPGMPSRSRLKELLLKDLITVNGKPARPSAKVRNGDLVVAEIPEPVEASIQPEPIPLEVIHQDRDLIVFDKPPGLLTHPTPKTTTGTLVNALLHHCDDLSGIGGAKKPGIVHRLDKDTSGVMVAAKNDSAHQALAKQFADHSIERKYIALVHGEFRALSGKIESRIGRNPRQRLKMTSKAKRGRRAVTRYKVLARARGMSLVELALETGRTHQIRVHLSENNHPVVGDPLYGKGRALPAGLDPDHRAALQAIKRQALHAFHLGFEHPSGEWMAFQSPPTKDIIDAAEKLGLLAKVELPTKLRRIK